MNMISTGTFQNEMDASNKQSSLVSKLVSAWEKKNAKAARAGGVSLMALSLAACGSSDSDDDTSSADSTTTVTPVTPVNQSFAGTTGLDALTGGAGNDSFSASNTTLNAGDSFSGGDGSDTLAVFSAAAATIGGFTATDVETISVSSTAAAAATIVSLNMGSVSGETGLQVTGSSSSVTFTNTDNIAPLTLSYNSAGNVVVTYNTTTVAGTADAMTVNTTDTTSGVVNIAGVETLTINNTGISSVATMTTTSATTVNVTGSGTLTLTDVDDATTTIDMSAFTGTSTVGGLGAVALTLTGGSGSDTVIAAVANIASTDTITGGDGADTLRLDDGGLTAANFAGVSGFETIELRNTGGDDTIDASVLGGTINIRVADQTNNGNAELTTVSNAANTQNITMTDSTEATDVADANDGVSLTVTQAAGIASSADVLNLTLSGEAVNTITANEYETVNITTAGAAASSVVAFNATTAQNIVVSGAQALTLTAVDMEEQSATTTSIIDASAMTGALTVTTSNNEGNQTITGGAGNDAITMNSLTALDSIVGNGGTDTLTVTNVSGALGEINVDVDRLTLSSDGTTTGGAVTVDLRNASTLSRLTIDLNDGSGGAVDENISATQLEAGATVYVLDDFAANTDVLTIGGKSGSTSQTIIFDGSGATDYFNGDLTANFDNLTLTTNSANDDITIDLLSSSGLDNLTLTGAGDVTITAATDTTSLDTLSAGSVTGAITLTSLARAAAADITLGTGNDSINWITTSHANNTIAAGAGTDTIVMSGASSANMIVDLSSATDQITSLSGAPNTAAQTGFENVTASAVTTSGVNVTGTSGANTIIGSNQADTINSGEGIDLITGNDGNDVITLTETTSVQDTLFYDNRGNEGQDSVTGFVSGTDKLDLQYLGDANGTLTTVTGQFTIADNEIYFFVGNTAGDADGTTAAAAAVKTEAGGQATDVNDAANTREAYFVIADDNSTGVFYYLNNNIDDSAITAGELTLVATLDSVLAAGDIIA